MADLNHIFGSCACERNQYTIVIPSTSTSQAQVFFDNSAASRRVQASPVTAWLRVPLDWYHSSTFAEFPDETHASIKRTFYTHTSNPAQAPTRRSFCGYCGSHLTAWRDDGPQGSNSSADYVDVTLGSLLNESLDKLEGLQLYGDDDSESGIGLVKGPGDHVDQEEHIPINESSTGGMEGLSAQAPAASRLVQQGPAHRMQGRGMPYFEELVENSRLGRIKRQKGGHTSADGSTRVQWEVVEMLGDDKPMSDAGSVAAGNGSKRIRLDT